MAQLFRPRANWIFRLVLAGGVLGTLAVAAGALAYVRTGAYWDVGKAAPQPIPFQHSIHAGGLGLDCRFCHSSVERSAEAGMPSAHTCLTCHAQVWSGASVLEPLRTSVALGVPIRWSSVHALPSYAYFNHGAHTQAGVSCASCHGRVETMERTVKAETLSMGWCLDCHRRAAREPSPAPAIGLPPASDSMLGVAPDAWPRKALHTAAQSRLTDCSTCHR